MLEKAQEKKRKSKGKQRRKKHEDDMSDEEIAQQLEGWLTCERCVVSKHWVSQSRDREGVGLMYQGCLLGNEKKQTLEDLQEQEGPVEHGCRKIRGVGIDEEASFLCSRCRDDPRCLVCHEDKLPNDIPDDRPVTKGKTNEAADQGMLVVEIANPDGQNASLPVSKEKPEAEGEDIDMEEDERDGYLRFRCFRCKQEARYEHRKLPRP